MTQRLSAKLRLWSDGFAGMDDPQGEYLLSLVERLCRLESEMEQLRRTPSVNSAPAETMSSTAPL